MDEWTSVCKRFYLGDPKLLSQICDMRIILEFCGEGMNVVVGSNHRMSLGHLQLWLVTLYSV